MEMGFDISKFDSYKEDNCREVKKAKGGLPISLWDTYSAMCNTNGGVIILGIKELDDRSWGTTGLKLADKEKLLDDFWNTANNPQKISINLLAEDDIEVFEVKDDIIIVIHVPMAKREQKPVYINNDMFKGSFKRTHTGDYHCTTSQVKSMLRDQVENTMDMEMLEDFNINDLNVETINSYRNRHKLYNPDHIWNNLPDNEYLLMIGALKKDKTGNIHPTAAGLLMFGEEYRILSHYPEYFLDYREMLDPTIRWSDRLQSSSGDWTGNLFDFYFKTINKIALNIKVPFKLENGIRVGDTPVHKAIREVLANCLVNTDFYISRGIVIKLEPDTLTIANPGSIRVGKHQMKLGGESDPRNKALMKMFNLIGVGERAGSGVPELFSVWANKGWEEPIIEERFDPDRTILTMPFTKKGESGKDKLSDEEFLSHSAISRSIDINLYVRLVEYLKEPRTRAELQEFCGIKSRPYFSSNVLEPLIETGKVELTIPEKPKSPKQKYIWHRKK